MANPKPNKTTKFLQFTSMPFEMFLIIFAGYKLGAWMDIKFPNTSNWFTLGGTLLSVIIAMIYIIRRVQKIAQ